MDMLGDHPENLSRVFLAALLVWSCCLRFSLTEGLRMSQLLAKATLITRMAIAMTIVSLAFGAAGATSAPENKPECAGGASSVTAWVDANGTVHQSEPVTTGCIP
jgi:hypothetical protein